MSLVHHKTALVTGAGRGLGADLAMRLAGEGYAVAMHCYKSHQGALDIRDAILQIGGRAEVFAADLTHPEGGSELVERMIETMGQRLDLLINNAGVYQPIPLESMGAEDWLTGLHSTASATFFTTQAALPWLRAAGRGRVVNIGDSGADHSTAREMALGYHIGKAGVWMLTRSYARKEAAYGVTVNMVSPGYLSNSLPCAEPEAIPAGRLGTFDDVWSAVRFLIDERSSYVTGTNIVVSGGWNL